MLPGKKYTPEDFVYILLRRIWFVLLPFAVVSAGVAVYARKLPDLYRSEAVIMVVPPRVAEGLVAQSVVSKIEDRLPAIQQQVTSRSRLERVIIDLDLYKDERRTGIMEDIVERMRNAISVQMVRGDAFRVSFTGGDASTVMKVAERISSLLMEESARDREALVEGTDQFLETQLESARTQLIEHERRLAEYRRKHAGELPTQIDSNLQAVQAQQVQLQAVNAQLDHDQERKTLLERQLADLESNEDQSPAASASSDTGTAAQLAAARSQLAQMQLVLTTEHPDVQRKRREVRDLEAKLEAESIETPLATDGGRKISAAELARQRRATDFREQIKQLDVQIARSKAESERLRQIAQGYLARAEAGPNRETEMVELNRDYAQMAAQYQSLLGKKQETTLSANLERRQNGQQFKILDQARLPTRPYSPDRRRLNILGMGAGLGLGLVLVAFLEYRNVGLTTDDEVISVLALPVLAVVPRMESDPERLRRTRWRLLMSACFGSVVAACLAVLAYTFVR